MITITKTEFKTATGRDLISELARLDDTPDQAADRTIALWTERTYDEIRAGRGYREDDKMTDFQKESIKRAIREYGLYYLANGDLYLCSGIDENGAKVFYPQIEQMKYPRECLDVLRRAGLINQQTNHRVSIYSEEI